MNNFVTEWYFSWPVVSQIFNLYVTPSLSKLFAINVEPNVEGKSGLNKFL